MLGAPRNCPFVRVAKAVGPYARQLLSPSRALECARWKAPWARWRIWVATASLGLFALGLGAGLAVVVAQVALFLVVLREAPTAPQSHRHSTGLWPVAAAGPFPGTGVTVHWRTSTTGFCVRPKSFWALDPSSTSTAGDLPWLPNTTMST